MDDRDRVIRADSLSKRFGPVQALDRLTLDVCRGEVLGFLGPNGAGKTTTMRLLMGYIRPPSGSARVHGLDSWRDHVTVHARTGYLPGDLRLWPGLSAGAIAAHLARLRGLDHDLDCADLAKRLDVDLARPVVSCPRATGRRRASCSRCSASQTCCYWTSRPAQRAPTRSPAR